MCNLSHELLKDRRALVTGAEGGVGRAVVAAMRSAGAEVVGADIEAGEWADILCDVTSEEEVGAAFRDAGAVTDVVHAAGVLSVGPVRDLELAEWNRTLHVNLTGSFLVAREAARRLGEGGTLTLISSQGGLRGGARWGAYCASKFGVVGLGQCLAQELAPAGVRVNVVCPGTVDTEMTRHALRELAQQGDDDEESLRARYEQAIPLGRFATSEEVGRVCVFLASELSSYVVGSSLVADGGELTA